MRSERPVGVHVERFEFSKIWLGFHFLPDFSKKSGFVRGYHRQMFINFSAMATRFTSKGSVIGALLRLNRPLLHVRADLSLYLHRPEDSPSPVQIEGHLSEKAISTVLDKPGKTGAVGLGV